MTDRISASIDAALASIDRALEALPTAPEGKTPTIPQMVLSHNEIMAFEEFRFNQLRMIAEQMTALGLPGADPDDPRIRALLERGAAATETYPELVDWIAANKDRR